MGPTCEHQCHCPLHIGGENMEAQLLARCELASRPLGLQPWFLSCCCLEALGSAVISFSVAEGGLHS